MANNDLLLGWAVGLFEGEGCIAHNKKTDLWALILVSTDHDVVSRFHEIVGVGTVRPQPARQEGHKPTWKWQAAARADVQKVLTDFLLLLGDRRRIRAQEALTSIAARPANKHRSDVCPNGHLRVVGARRCVLCKKEADARYYVKKVAQ